MALELRPTCEHCNKALPAVCPNCGGGFVPRPIRPSRQWKAHERFAAAIRSTPPEKR